MNDTAALFIPPRSVLHETGAMSDLTLRCHVCQALLDEEDLFCGNCGTEASAHEPQHEQPSRQSMHNFRCSGCGASMSYDPQAEGLSCPFCGSVKMVATPPQRVLAPSRVIPFAVTREAAVETMRRKLGEGIWRPGDLSQQALVVKMMPVYVPYWVFEAETHTYWTADSSQTPSGARSDWYPLTGEHRGRHAGILVGASGALSPQETAALCPFDLEQAVPADTIDLEQSIVEQFSVPRKYARPLARHTIEAFEAADCQARYVPGRVRNMKVNVLISGQTSEPVLLPVWIMAYRYRDRVFRFLVNGQTGKAAGQAPISRIKQLTAVAFFVLAVLLLIIILSSFMR